MHRTSCLLLIIALGPCASAAAEPKQPPSRPVHRHSAVLVIGDGMGPGFVTAARLAASDPERRLALDRLPYTAVVRTASASHLVTDSAAAATAMACGALTANGVLGEDAAAVSGVSHGARLENLAEWAHGRGYVTGVVTTTRVTHATPAAWYAHHHDKDDESEVARQLLESPLQLILGGGAASFPEPAPLWHVAMSWTSLQQDPPAAGRKVLGLFAPDHLPFESPGAAPPRLMDLVLWAVQHLEAAERPYLLIIEGGRIDHAAHYNWARSAIGEVLALDAVVGALVKRLDEARTLLLVTADHETAGLAVNGYPEWADGIWGDVALPGSHALAGNDVRYPALSFATGPGFTAQTAKPPQGAEEIRHATRPMVSGAHTATDVALYGWGEGAEAVRGTVDHTAVFRLLQEQLARNRHE